MTENQKDKTLWFNHEDVIAPHEQAIEDKWKEQKGTDPDTGEAWITPRMTRNAIRTEAAMRLEDAGIRQILDRTISDKARLEQR